MNKLHNKNLSQNSKNLRKNMTKEEKHLWYDFLKNLPIQFYRQKIVGSYIVDFYCAAEKLAIEVDGSQHYEDAGVIYDKKRDEFLKSNGITVLRYSNADINTRFDGVCEDILEYLKIYDDRKASP